jgi:hypothetical protein
MTEGLEFGRPDNELGAPRSFKRAAKIAERRARGKFAVVIALAGVLVDPLTLAGEGAGCRDTQVQFLPEWEGAPVTKAVTDVGELVMVWDTGAPVSIIRKQLAIDSHAKSADDFLESKRFMLGGTEFGPLALRAFDYQEPQGTDGFIGHSFFATHVVCADFQSRRLLVRGR